MAIEVVMPRQGNTVESCLIAEWRVAVGDTVDKGQVLCEIETDKSSIEIEAAQEGTVLALLHQAGDEVPVLKPILVLGTPGEDISRFLADAPGDSPDDHAAAPATEDSKATRAPTPQDQP